MYINKTQFANQELKITYPSQPLNAGNSRRPISVSHRISSILNRIQPCQNINPPNNRIYWNHAATRTSFFQHILKFKQNAH